MIFYSYIQGIKFRLIVYQYLELSEITYFIECKDIINLYSVMSGFSNNYLLTIFAHESPDIWKINKLQLMSINLSLIVNK